MAWWMHPQMADAYLVLAESGVIRDTSLVPIRTDNRVPFQGAWQIDGVPEGERVSETSVLDCYADVRGRRFDSVAEAVAWRNEGSRPLTLAEAQGRA